MAWKRNSPGCGASADCGCGFSFYLTDGFLTGSYKLWTVPSTGGTCTLIGSLGLPSGSEPGGLSGLEYDVDDNLLGISFGAAGQLPKVYDVNKATGAATNARTISGFTSPNGTPCIGLARRVSDDTWFTIYRNAANTDRELYTLAITASSAVATLVGTCGVALVEGDMAFDPTDETLYACENAGVSRKLYTVDTSTGALTAKSGSIVTSGEDVNGLTFDSSGQLWGYTNAAILKVDKSDGTTSETISINTGPTGSTGGMRIVQ